MCRALPAVAFIYSYIYNQILKIEKALSFHIAKSEIYERKILDILYNRDNSENSKEALTKFEADRKVGIDRNLIEYL